MTDEKKLYRITTVILAAAAVICLFFGIQVVTKGYVKIGGYSTFRVVTGSMEPTISTDALLLCKETKIEKIKTGDIVCYRTQIAEIYGSIVTHRVVEVHEDDSGTIYLETKGDANATSDPYYVDSWELVGKVVWYSSEKNVLNTVMSFLSSQIGFLVSVVFPMLLVSGLILQNSVKNLQRDLALAKQELEQAAEKKQEKDALLPGYQTLTYGDYEAIYEALKKELLEELDGKTQETDGET